jgi:tetratricopeptide (TPR) repeat protein
MLEHLDTLIAFVVVMAVVSLMITLAAQMISGLLGLRGAYLKWGLEQLLTTLHPGMKPEALVSAVLTHPLISDSAMAGSLLGRWLAKVPVVGQSLVQRWQLAKAIRVDEVVRVLRAIADDTTGRYQDAQNAAKEVLSKIDLDAASKILAVTAELRLIAPQETEKANQYIRQIAETAQRAIGNLEAWFNSAMDRTSQRFALRIRLWTVAFSAIAAFGMQLDSVALLTQLSSDSELRAGLVARAEAVTNQANQILGNTGSAVPSAYVDAVEDLRRLKEKIPETQALGNPPRFVSREDGELWLRAQLGVGDRTNFIIGEYRDLVQIRLTSAIDQLKDQAYSLRAEIGKTKFQLIPDPYPGWKGFLSSLWPINRQFWGILASVGLLSLGAPFWFNALKTLATLRPIVAAKEQREQQVRA